VVHNSDAGTERFGLQWPGKAAARQAASTPTGRRLVDVPDESVDADSTGNTIIEGDNLDALKLLRSTHAGAVRLVYIDPPYNTGSDFVFRDNLSESAWLSMMYPRLLLARELLADDGVLMVSIDRNELAPLSLLLGEIFGAQNHLANLVWVSNLKGRQFGAGPAGTHEYIVCFARDAQRIGSFRGSASALHALMPAVYRRPGYEVKHDARGSYVTKNELYNTNSRFNEHTSASMVFRIHYHPVTGEVRTTDVDDETEFPGFVTALPHPNHRPEARWHAWRWSRTRVVADRDDLEFDVRGDTLRIRTKVRDIDGMTLKDLLIGPSTVTGQADLEALGLPKVFDTPKPVSLLRTLVGVTTRDDDLVLDFFAGSGTTAQAVMEQNAADDGRRRFLLVQLDERMPARRTAAFSTIADVTAERVRRAGAALRARHPTLDVGFRLARLR
jgi:adenine-specific DNA-methyltransferase